MKPKESIYKVWFQTDQNPNCPSIQKGKNRLCSALINEVVPAFSVTLQMIIFAWLSFLYDVFKIPWVFLGILCNKALVSKYLNYFIPLFIVFVAWTSEMWRENSMRPLQCLGTRISMDKYGVFM